jgi:hypothetical protein
MSGPPDEICISGNAPGAQVGPWPPETGRWLPHQQDQYFAYRLQIMPNRVHQVRVPLTDRYRGLTPGQVPEPPRIVVEVSTHERWVYADIPITSTLRDARARRQTAQAEMMTDPSACSRETLAVSTGSSHIMMPLFPYCTFGADHSLVAALAAEVMAIFLDGLVARHVLVASGDVVEHLPEYFHRPDGSAVDSFRFWLGLAALVG